MAQIAIFLDTETAPLAPGQRLVVPEATCVQTDVAANRSHIAQQWRRNRSGRLRQHGIMLAQEFRMLNGRKRSQCADFYFWSLPDTFQLRDVADVEHVLRLKEPLPHGWNQIGPAGQHTDIASMLRQVAYCLFQRLRAQQLEFRQAQSSPLDSAAASLRAGSSGCRSGPLPRNQSAPPCSRKRVGAVGSTPSVRFIGLAFLRARNAAKTRSGVNGASRSRIPTAS